MENIRIICLMFKKDSIISGNVLRLLNDYREFLSLKGKSNEKTLIKVFMTHCDLDDNPFDTKDAYLLDDVKKMIGA